MFLVLLLSTCRMDQINGAAEIVYPSPTAVRYVNHWREAQLVTGPIIACVQMIEAIEDQKRSMVHEFQLPHESRSWSRIYFIALRHTEHASWPVSHNSVVLLSCCSGHSTCLPYSKSIHVRVGLVNASLSTAVPSVAEL